MNIWSKEIRIRAVEAYIRSNSIIFAQRELRRGENRHHHIPDRRTISRWVNQWRTNASVVNKKHVGPHKTVRTPENRQRVLVALQQSPQRSVRRHARTLGMSRTSLRRIVKSDLKFHPYKLQVCQELRPVDRQNRVQFCTAFLERLQQDETILSALAMTDEANFHLSGFVNKQNLRYYAERNPQLLHEKPLHSQKIVVWCAIGVSIGIVGPYFFKTIKNVHSLSMPSGIGT